MRKLFFLFFLVLSCGAWAQQSMFVRVFDLNGHKIGKGKVSAVTDSSLVLVGFQVPVNISASQIGFIRTERSAGHNILVGAAINAAWGGFLGIISAQGGNSTEGTFNIFNYSAAQGAFYGTMLGSIGGAVDGALTLPFKHSRRILINGDLSKWKAFRLFASGQTEKKTSAVQGI